MTVNPPVPSEISPQVWARTGGVLYLIIIVAGLFGEMSRDGLIVSLNPGATAANLQASEWLWRASIGGNLVHLVCAVAMTLVFYVLLRPISRDISLLAAFFALVSIVIEASVKLNLIAALFPLGNQTYLAAFTAPQRDALAYLSIRAHAYGFGISLIFFGCACLAMGYLMFRSRYLPALLGVLMQIAGICYLVNSFALVLAPALENRIYPLILVPAFIGESSVCLWLIVKGVNVQHWRSWPGTSALAPARPIPG